MIIIGITGTQGSGKGTVVEYLKDKYGFKHYSGPDFITQEVLRRGMPANRDSKHIVGNDLRTKYGAGYIAEKTYGMAIAVGDNAVLESLRAVGEVEALRAKPEPFYLLAVDADPNIRYERVTTIRKDMKDDVSFEKFLEQEKKEMYDASPGGMNIAKCMNMADGRVTNNGDIAMLHAQIDRIVAPLILTDY